MMEMLRKCSECEFEWYVLFCNDSDKCPMCEVVMYRVRNFSKLKEGKFMSVGCEVDDLLEDRVVKYESNSIS